MESWIKVDFSEGYKCYDNGVAATGALDQFITENYEGLAQCLPISNWYVVNELKKSVFDDFLSQKAQDCLELYSGELSKDGKYFRRKHFKQLFSFKTPIDVSIFKAKDGEEKLTDEQKRQSDEESEESAELSEDFYESMPCTVPTDVLCCDFKDLIANGKGVTGPFKIIDKNEEYNVFYKDGVEKGNRQIIYNQGTLQRLSDINEALGHKYG